MPVIWLKKEGGDRELEGRTGISAWGGLANLLELTNLQRVAQGNGLCEYATNSFNE